MLGLILGQGQSPSLGFGQGLGLGLNLGLALSLGLGLGLDCGLGLGQGRGQGQGLGFGLGLSVYLALGHTNKKEDKMLIIVKTKVDEVLYEFRIEDNKEKEALNKSITLGNPPTFCHECQNKDFFRLDSNKDKEGNVYINTICKKCGAKAKLGEYKTGGYFWHRFEKYQGKMNTKTQEDDFDVDKYDEVQ